MVVEFKTMVDFYYVIFYKYWVSMTKYRTFINYSKNPLLKCIYPLANVAQRKNTVMAV